MDRLNDLGQPIGRPVAGWSPRPYPAPGVLAGHFCSLEPLVTAHAPALHDAYAADPTGRLWTYLPWGPFRDLAEVTAFVEGHAADPALVALAILDAAGSAAGTACYLRIEPAVGTVEVGGIVFGPALRRTPAATEAMYLMARYAFGLGYRRYEWKCDVLNAASQAAARRLGFAYEGTWRNATVYKGRNRDTAWYAMTDDDWKELRPAYEAWLSPSNFAPDGGQHTRLTVRPRS